MNKATSDDKVDVLDKGVVKLVDCCASDEAIVRSARVSYGDGTKKKRDDRALIRYLIKNNHETPLEHSYFCFYVKAPIFVFRQWHRHRAGVSINEISGRYSELKNDYYVPEETRLNLQSKTNKQCSSNVVVDKAVLLRSSIEQHAKESFGNYENYLEAGLSREVARINLPLSTYSEMYWSCNLRSLFHFLKLRLHKHAQREIQEYAKVMLEIIKPIVPVACEAFEDYILNSIVFSDKEMKIIRANLSALDFKLDGFGLSKRELKEFKEKIEPPTVLKK